MNTLPVANVGAVPGTGRPRFTPCRKPRRVAAILRALGSVSCTLRGEKLPPRDFNGNDIQTRRPQRCWKEQRAPQWKEPKR
jgi:hypothetical protein